MSDDTVLRDGRVVYRHNSYAIYGEPVLGRACGGCKFCCTHVPIERPLNKPAGVRCKHLISRGCSIHAQRPDVCRYWNCHWLYQPGTAGMRRPDLAGYCIDPMPQQILVDGRPLTVLQVWVDGARRDAHRDPALRAYLATMAEQYKVCALVRWSGGKQEGSDALFLAPPAWSADGQWIEKVSPMLEEVAFNEKLAAAKL